MVRRGEPPPKGDGWKQCTIGSNAKHRHAFNLHCDDCRRAIEVDAAEFMARHSIPADMPAYTLVQRLRCGVCGSTNVCLMVAPVNAPGYRMRS